VKQILQKVAVAKKADLEAWETALRAAVLSCGGKILGGLLEGIGSGRSSGRVICQCGTRMESQGLREKELLTILGPVPYSRSMFQCPVCQATRYPGDELLDVMETTRSSGLRRMMVRAGSNSTFKVGQEDLKVYAGIEVSAKDIERVAEGIGQQMESWSSKEREEILKQDQPHRSDKSLPLLYISYDGTGVPMTPGELRGRRGKQADGSAKTREAKIGLCFYSDDNRCQGISCAGSWFDQLRWGD